jgi:hypothetical protein
MADAFIPPTPRRLTESFLTPTPTRRTLFLRTFVPWQMVRFAIINLKMLFLIRRSHMSHPR